MEPDDRELLNRIQQGDGESFGLLFDRTHRWLLQFVIIPRVGRTEAEDVLEETFLAALGSIRQFQWRGVGLLHWLAVIAKRKSMERVRRRNRDPEALEDLALLLELPGDSPTAEAEMMRAEAVAQARDRVAQTLGRIRPRYADALRMRLLEETSRSECAQRLSVSAETFDVILYRATRAFAREWSKT